jgi:hypothetical protein
MRKPLLIILFISLLAPIFSPSAIALTTKSSIAVNNQNIVFNSKITDYNLYNCSSKETTFTIYNAKKSDKYNNQSNISGKQVVKYKKLQLVDMLNVIYLSDYKKSYYFRCLPDDFPIIAFKQTSNYDIKDGFFLMPYYARTLSGHTFSSNYLIITDTNGGVLWYNRTSGASTYLNAIGKNQLISRGVPNGFHPGTPTLYNSAKVTDLNGKTIEDYQVENYLSRPTFVKENGNILLSQAPNRKNVDISKLNVILQDQTAGKCIIDKTNVTISGVGITEKDPSGKTVFEVDLTDKIPFTSSSKANIVNQALDDQPLDCAIDIFHQNSITESEDGKGYLLSNRWSGVYYIDKASKEVLWHLGSYKSEKSLEILSDPLGTKGPVGQHGGYLTKDNKLLLFDNQTDKHILARGVEYQIDPNSKKAVYIRSFSLGMEFCVELEGSYNCAATSQGNIELLPKNNLLVSWGNTDGRSQMATIFSPKGTPLATLSIISPKANVFALYYASKDKLDPKELRKTASSKVTVNHGTYPIKTTK